MSSIINSSSAQSKPLMLVGFAFLAALALVLPNEAFAGGLSGGLSNAKSSLDTIKTWLMAAAGVAAVIYLLFKAVQAWQGRCEWGEFGMSVFYVALAGGAVTIANWAFTLFA